MKNNDCGCKQKRNPCAATTCLLGNICGYWKKACRTNIKLNVCQILNVMEMCVKRGGSCGGFVGKYKDGAHIHWIFTW